MTYLTEYSIVCYKHGTTPSDGKVVWSELVDRGTSTEKAEKALDDLRSKDDNLHKYVEHSRGILKREIKDADFNTSLEEICTFEFKSHKSIHFHRKALQRLARYLSRRDKKYNYYSVIPYENVGENIYVLFSKQIEKLDDSDKLKKIKRLRSARKGALTRSRNKMQKIIERYMSTLTPDGAKDDPRYISLKKNLVNQEKRYEDVMNMKTQDISDYTGSLSKVRV